MGKARDYMPALRYGHKIYPYDLAGAATGPHVGNIYYVDANNGSDSSSGTSWEDAFATLKKAYDTATTNNYDVIVVAPNGTSGTSETEQITWSKNHITVIGASAPAMISPRSRVVWTTDALDPCLIISGQGNSFINIQLATFQASNDILVQITGNRNYFQNVHFAGIGHATAGDDATARCIDINGGEENLFDSCTIGLDTVSRSTSNAELELRGAATRNIFRDCMFVSYADNAGHLFVKAADSGGMDRFTLFQRCLFHNAGNSAATTMTVAMDTHTSLGGSIILHDSWLFGATDWADDFGVVEVAGGAQATGSTAGLMVAAS